MLMRDKMARFNGETQTYIGGKPQKWFPQRQAGKVLFMVLDGVRYDLIKWNEESDVQPFGLDPELLKRKPL